MTNSTSPSKETLPQRLQKSCYSLQKLEQQLSLLGHKSDQITEKMQRIRQSINLPTNPKTEYPKNNQK